MLRQALPRRARILIVTRDEDVVLRARLAFGEDRVESLVDDEAADLYVDQMCGQIIEWKYRAKRPKTASGAGNLRVRAKFGSCARRELKLPFRRRYRPSDKAF